MKKLLVVMLLVAVSAGLCSADEHIARNGILSYAGMSVEEYNNFIAEGIANNVWEYYLLRNSKYPAYLTNVDGILVNFDSLTEMIMALDVGKVDRIEFARPVGEYFLRQGNNSDKYVNYVDAKGVNYYLSMGFNEGSKWFEPFNTAIKAMNDDDTLLFLKAKYVDSAKIDLKPITFETFPDAETVKIAVTGDMPPIDYVAADGRAAGFNTALLAEIAKRLKVNVELVSINAGARAAALASGRADGVFWFWYDRQTKPARDVPQGVALTEPYYTWDTWLYVGKRIH